MIINDILKSREVLAKLNNAKGIPSVAAYRIGKNVMKLEEELKPYNDARIKVLEEFSNKDENGEAIINKETRQYDIPWDKFQDLLKEIEVLENEEINVDIKKVAIEDIDKAELSPRELMTIEFMLKV